MKTRKETTLERIKAKIKSLGDQMTEWIDEEQKKQENLHPTKDIEKCLEMLKSFVQDGET